jgi:hypothetical protein
MKHCRLHTLICLPFVSFVLNTSCNGQEKPVTNELRPLPDAQRVKPDSSPQISEYVVEVTI